MPVLRRKRSRPRETSAIRLLDADIARAQGSSTALGWILEMLEGDPTYLHRRMFGCDAGYIDGLLCLVTASNGEPWNGLLVCTSLDRQPALRADWPALNPHPVLGKWLYLSQDDPDFEATAQSLVTRAIARDPRIGVEPKPKKKKKKTLRKRQAKTVRVQRARR